jgi:hypothetical protein
VQNGKNFFSDIFSIKRLCNGACKYRYTSAGAPAAPAPAPGSTPACAETCANAAAACRAECEGLRNAEKTRARRGATPTPTQPRTGRATTAASSLPSGLYD